MIFSTVSQNAEAYNMMLSHIDKSVAHFTLS